MAALMAGVQRAQDQGTAGSILVADNGDGLGAIAPSDLANARVIAAREAVEAAMARHFQAREELWHAMRSDDGPRQLRALEAVAAAQTGIQQRQADLLAALQTQEEIVRGLVTAEETRIYGPGGPTVVDRILNGAAAAGGVTVGIAEGSLYSVGDVFVGAYTIVAHPIDTYNGVIAFFNAPPRTTEEQRAADLAAFDRDLAARLAAVGSPFQSGREGGVILGRYVIGPLATGGLTTVTIEVVGRTGLITRVLPLAAGGDAATVAANVERAAQIVRITERAVDGLPEVSGTLVGNALGQGNQYLPFLMADGRTALVYRATLPSDLQAARTAIETMNRAHPGLMPQVYGMTRLADGTPALVLERFENATVLMNNMHAMPGAAEAFRGVFTSSAYAEWRTMGGFGRGLDNDYLFIDAAGRPRMAVPRRAGQFLELVESGRIFQGTAPPVP